MVLTHRQLSDHLGQLQAQSVAVTQALSELQALVSRGFFGRLKWLLLGR